MPKPVWVDNTYRLGVQHFRFESLSSSSVACATVCLGLAKTSIQHDSTGWADMSKAVVRPSLHCGMLNANTEALQP